MREIWARRIAYLTVLSVILLAASFAAVRNRPRTVARGAEGASRDGALRLVEEGRAVYEARRCARCHAVSGMGNRRSPLDGVGARLSPREIRGRILAAPEQREALPGYAAAAKEQYQQLPARDLDALVAFVISLP
jgi:mono/diheme cytochrome c family protein